MADKKRRVVGFQGIYRTTEKFRRTVAVAVTVGKGREEIRNGRMGARRDQVLDIIMIISFILPMLPYGNAT